MSYRFLTEDRLLAQCRVDHYRGSGPGGQKRNKTSNAVRLSHTPTGVVATATESRSTAENHLWAVRRLRIKIAADVREPVDRTRFEVPDWMLEIRRDGRLAVSHRHPFYTPAAGLMLDLLDASAGDLAAVAVNLGLSTTTILRLLQAEHAWWAAAAAIRARFGLDSLTARR